MSAIKLAARVALNDIGECMVSAIKALDAGDFDAAMAKIDESTSLLERAFHLVAALEEAAGGPS